MPDPIQSTSSSGKPVDLNQLIGGLPASEQPKAKDTNTYFDKEMFLRLLVTQLKYQDPTKPMDSAQFMQQASQLASVEQMQAMVKSQQDSTAVQKSVAAAAMVGKVISGLDADGVEVEGVCSRVLIDSTGVNVILDEKLKIPMSQVTSIADPSTMP